MLLTINAIISFVITVKWGSDLLLLDGRSIPWWKKMEPVWWAATLIGGFFWPLPLFLVYVPMAYEKWRYGY